MTTTAENELRSIAALVADFLVANGVERVFGLQGGHIQPVWDQLARRGVAIVDVRHEAAAVHMAHAQAELTGRPGVALVTAGPGVTNTVTSMSNAFVSRAPVLLLGGCAPMAQSNMGALQDIDHVGIMKPVTRRARTLREPGQVLREMSEALGCTLGDAGDPGPVYIEIPTDVLRATIPDALVLDEHLRAVTRHHTTPAEHLVAAAADLLLSTGRIAVITGRGARRTQGALARFLDATGAAYLDTQESRGLVPSDHPAYVGAMRSRVMEEAELVVTVGRRLDYQLGYGSPAVFPNAQFLRISDTAAELTDNRRGQVEILSDVEAGLDEIANALTKRDGEPDTHWRDSLAATHRDRAQRYRDSLSEAPDGSDGLMHPNRIFAAVQEAQLDDPVVVADGGDLLSFARLGMNARTYLDSGAFGCLGVGVPFAIAAALEDSERPVISFNGDGAFGLNAMEIDTAVRHGARAVFIVANNRAWNIERYDQESNYGLVVGTELGDSDYAAMATALGAHGQRVTDSAQLPEALQKALANAPAVIQVDVSRDAVSPDADKGLGFVAEYQALTPWNDRELERRALPVTPATTNQKDENR